MIMYTLVIKRRAQKELAQLPAGIYERVRDVIRTLARAPRPQGCLKLANRPAWRIRIGDYRVIYEIDDRQQVVTVVDIGHRRDVYR
jgi:mRNA interferase RelE/StbE